ncbi:MAG: hypothetical protein OXI03_09490, partial [Chloroflexota bacterium]|nr:hypothetical protein [Chloroflexota bacterium]
MADRRRFAVVAAPLLALLAALLLGWSVAAAQAPDPLTLTITAGRSECTAGTLNPVTWEISGGVEPYALIVDGTPVEAGARHTTVICPALPEGATEAPATVSATVADAAGETVTSRAAYTIVPPFHGPLFSERTAGVESLSLTLTALRAECTAGTLNPVVWTIKGGTPPDTLTVDGAVVNVDAERTMVTCGDLPEGASQAPATITAVVADASGATATARAAYTIVPPLPAPESGRLLLAIGHVLAFIWYTAEPPPDSDELVAFLVRQREVGSPTWDYWSEAPASHPGSHYQVRPALRPMRDAVTYEMAVAAMRHPLEAETPAALRWTPSLQGTPVTDPANVTTTATHDTVTVRWDRQPSATDWSIRLTTRRWGAARPHDQDYSSSMGISPSDAEAWGDPASATHEVTFRHLVPDTEYNLSVGSGGVEELPGRYTHTTVRTKAAPAGYTPLPRGPQNLRATSTVRSITVTWDPPYAGARESYSVYLYGPDGSRLDIEDVYSPPWTVTFTSSAVNGGRTRWWLAPETTYRISVSHWGAIRAEAEISIATKAWAPAPASDPLTLILTAERSECTAGTLNSVSWEIRGGVEPYRDLLVGGAPVEADAESATFTCGALPEGASAARGTVWVSVRDATNRLELAGAS